MPLLRRGELEVILCFDGDLAGINAATKSALLLSQNGIDGSVVIIDGGADPADMVLAGKVDYLRQIFNSGIELGEFYIRQLVKEFDINRPVQKQKALEMVQNYTSSLKPLIANSYTQLVANLLKIEPNTFWLTRKNIAKPLPQYQVAAIDVKTSNIKDNLEIQILKTITENNELKDEILSVLKPEYFSHHRDIFEAIVRCEVSDEAILRELAFENCEILKNSSQVAQVAKILKKRFYEKMLKQTQKSNRSDKIEVLDRLRKILKELEK